MLSQPLHDLASWTRHFRSVEIPVLPTTVEELALLKQTEDEHGNVDAQTLALSVASDPLMTLKVLIEVESRRRSRTVTGAETVTEAIVMMGVTPFFHAFGNQKDVMTWLGDQPPAALMGLQRVVRRSHRAANFALSFAIHRMDEDAVVIQEAALIHDFCEMLLWLHAPALALRIAQIQKADPALRSSAVQREVLNIELQDLAQSLMQVWHLPELLQRLADDKHADHPRVRCVMLAVRLARHTQDGWGSPGAQAALPDDVADIAALLNLSTTAAHAALLDVDRS
ncbi:MAG: HDOD domain-containing protein [Aquabacterium sp.]|nr:MAG: HDOD domain-containing protein [Aquabacterium sp.]